MGKELPMRGLRFFALFCVFFYFCIGLEAKETVTPEPVAVSVEAEMLVLEFRFKRYVLTEGLLGYLNASGLYVPLGEVIQILDFPIHIDLDAKQAVGWFLSKNRRFFLDIAQGKAIVEGKSSSFNPDLVFLESGDIFVNLTLLNKWLPLDFEFDISQMVVQVSSEETLPFEARLEREETHARLKGRVKESVTYPYQANPYSILSWPTIDSSSDFDYSEDADTYTLKKSARISGDFLFMNTEIYGSGDKEDGLTNLRIKMGRQDPNSQLLGLLKVSEFSIGDIYSPQIPLVASSNSGAGFKISTFPLSKETEFDRIDLRGELLVGWEVELYRNEVLLDVRSEPNDDGRYEFLDTSLLFGSNIIRLIFHGPQGQRYEETHRYNVGSDQAPPGKTYFRFSTTLQDEKLFNVDDIISEDEDEGKLRYIAEFQHGINRLLSLTGNFTSLQLDEERHNYSTLGFRTGILGALSRFDVTRSGDGGTALEAAILTRYKKTSLFLEHTRFYDFESERESNSSDPVLHRSNIRLESSIPETRFLPRIPWSITADFEKKEPGEETIGLKNRLSFFAFGISASNTLSWSETSGEDIETNTDSDGSLQLSGRLMNIRLRGSLGYLLKPDAELSNAVITGNYRWNKDFSVRLGVTERLEGEELTTFNVGFNRTFERFAIGIDGDYNDDGAYSVGSTVTFSIGREPRTGEWKTSADRMASTGMVSALVYIDVNGNKVFDEGDKPLDGVKFNHGKNDQKTDEKGIVLLTGLSRSRPSNIILDIPSLEDPFLVPMRTGYEIVARPGRPVMLNFPIAPTGEVDGNVFLRSGDQEKLVSNVDLQLLNADNEVVSETKSEYDGFYLFQMIPMGRYWLRIAPDQIARLGLKPVKPLEIILEEADAFKLGIDLILEQKASTIN